MKFPIGSMTVGDVLDRGLKMLFARLPLYYMINLIAISPVIVLLILQPFVLNMAPRTPEEQQTAAILTGIVAIVVLVLVIVLSQIGAAAILKTVMNDYIDQPVSLGGAMSFAFSKFGPLFVTSFLAGLIILIGFFLCIIPGIYFAIAYIFASQVVVLENMSGMPALNRSKSLVKGYAGRIFGTVFLIMLASTLVNYGLTLVLTKVLPSFELIRTARGIEQQFRPLNHILDVLVTQGVSILFSTYAAVCTTLLYLDMRIRKEGFDLELQAKRSAGETA